MSLNNGQLHGVAFVGTLVLGGALLLGTVILADSSGDSTHMPELKEMVAIEASLARKSEKKKQPQKELKVPEPPPPPEVKPPDPKVPDAPVKPEGVSHDENKKPNPIDKPKVDKKPPPKKPAVDDKPVDIAKQFHHPSDDEPQAGAKPTTDIGQFDGSEKGFAPITTGNPYWQSLVADFHQVWEIPTISKVNGATVACFHIEPDGRIAESRIDARSGDETLDDSVQRAMKATQKARNAAPQPVPTEQLGVIHKWVCFRFNPNQ
jgi:outer membrane biosynthesis protein TonB